MNIDGSAFNTSRTADITSPTFTTITASKADLTQRFTQGAIKSSGSLISDGATSRLQQSLQQYACAPLQMSAIKGVDQYSIKPPVKDSGRGGAMPADRRRSDTVEGIKQQRLEHNILPASGGKQRPAVEKTRVPNKLRKAPPDNRISKETISAPQLQSSTVLLDTLKTISAGPHNNRSRLGNWLHLDSKPASKIDKQDISWPTDLIGSRNLKDIVGTPVGQFVTPRAGPPPPKGNIRPPETERSVPLPKPRDSRADRQPVEQQLHRQLYLNRSMSVWSVDTEDTRPGMLDKSGQFFSRLTAGFKRSLKHPFG